MAKTTGSTNNAAKQRRTYLKQDDVPSASLTEALRMPQTIFDQYAGEPTAPLHVAKALNVNPKGSQLRVLSGAAIAYGLIEGGAQASLISVTDLARRIIRPKEEDEDTVARREAVLRPRVFGDFLRKYDGNPFPRKDIALNVLEGMGVPRSKANDVLDRIQESAEAVGFIEEIKGKSYVTLQGAANFVLPVPDGIAADGADADGRLEAPLNPARPPTTTESSATTMPPLADDAQRKRVFITHGKNRDLVDPIRKLLEYGELEPVVSVERQSVSKPVPEKVMDDMRRAGAAIIHVDADQTIEDVDGNEHVMINPNVLIEIGAAMAFYGKRFILLVRDGVKLPSNLQGLYEVRYTGNTLDADATIRLLEAIKDIKNYSLPTDPKGNSES